MIRVVTWNIGGGYVSTDDHISYNRLDIDYFADRLKEISPDIVCVQEAHVSGMLDQPSWLAEALGFYSVAHAYDDSHLHSGSRLAAAILSRSPLKMLEFVTLPNPRLKLLWKGEEVTSHEKGFLLARVSLNGQDVRVASGHMLPFHRFGHALDDSVFDRVWASTKRLFLGNAGVTLIGGDMNFAELPQGLKTLRRRYGCVPFSETRPDGRVTDHIIYPKDWILVRSEARHTNADHHLCMADLEIGEN